MAHKKDPLEFAVIGLGRFGSSVALTLVRRGHTVLGIDKEITVVQRLADEINQAVALDSTDEDALNAMDIASFDTVIVGIGQNFEANVMTTVALKSIGAKHVICKALTERQKEILLRIGADQVVLPEHEAGQHLAEDLTSSNMLRPHKIDQNHSVAEIPLPASLIGCTLAEANMRKEHEITVLAIRRSGHLNIAPPADFPFRREDTLVALGTNDAIERLSKRP